MHFYTHVGVFGEVEDLAIVSPQEITSSSNITVYTRHDTLEIHGEILVDQPSIKKKCRLPRDSALSILSLVAQGSVVISSIDASAINPHAHPLLVTLTNGAKLRAGLGASHVFCKLESGSAIDTFKRHAGVAHRWTVACFEARMQPGCSVQGITVTEDAKFVVTVPHTSTARPTVGDVVIKPGAALALVPKASFRDKAPYFKVVRESSVPLQHVKIAPEPCPLGLKKKMETILMRCITPSSSSSSSNIDITESTEDTEGQNGSDAIISSSTFFYSIAYKVDGQSYVVTTHNMPPKLPVGALVTGITPLGSNPSSSLIASNSLPPPLSPKRKKNKNKREAPDYRLYANGEDYQRILDNFHEIAERQREEEQEGEQLDLKAAFVIPEEFRKKYEPFFEIQGNTSVVDCVHDETLSKEGRCVLCLTNTAIVVVHDCYHRAMCLACAEASKYLTDTCPICKAKILKAIVPF
jgi:hypothetical protein